MTAARVSYAFEAAPEHALTGHPESPDRFRALDPEQPLDLPDIELQRLEPEILRREELALVHDPGYLMHLRQVMDQGPGVLDHGDTYFTPQSWTAARRAAGGAVAVTRVCLAQPNSLGLSIARPPGHHATKDQPLGFCLLNNIALAARTALQQGLERVMIVDFDVHHGNGTQDIFYQDPRVFFISLHQQGIFPDTGRLEERGWGEAEGTTVNVPLPAGLGDEGYLLLARELLPRLAAHFQPQLLLLSAGFDGHWQDPLAGLRLSARTYFGLGALLHDLAAEHCQGRIVYVQEGGYSATALADCLLATVHGLLGLEAPADPNPAPNQAEPGVTALLERVLQHIP